MKPPTSWTWPASACTTAGPMLSGGTKWPSMTSTWIVRAPASSTVADLLAEAGEVGGEDRGCDAGGRRHQIGWSIELRQWLHV